MIDQTFPGEISPRVEVRVQSGNVRLVPGEAKSVRVVAEAHKDAGLEVSKRGATIVVSTDKGGWFRNDKADITIYVPESTEASINAASADVRVTTPLSRLEVNTATGDITFATVGSLEVRTASGDVRGDRVTESVRVVGASGDVQINSCSGKASFSSASGDVEIGHCQGGSLKTSTASGDVSVALCQSSEVECKSMSGDVDLGIPPRTRVSLDASTLSGNVRLPEPSESSEPPESSMSIKVRLVSGDMRLFRAG